MGFFALYFWFMSRVFRHREIINPRFCSVYLSARFKTALLCKFNVDNTVWNLKHIRNSILPLSPQTPQHADPSANLPVAQVCSWLLL